MASAYTQSKFLDLKLCSICLAPFKVPRCLPCSHSFCHQCLSSHILSTCEQKDVPLGFSCPLCREFVPSPGQPDDSDHWAERFPVSTILAQLTEESEAFTTCWACRRENEDEEATDYCITCKETLCKLCAKYHRRNLASQNHEICLISEIGSHNIDENNDTTFCDKHEGRYIELYCNDHDTLCCAVCISSEHKKCDELITFEEAAENLKRRGFIEALLYDIKRIKNELGEAKKNEEENAIVLMRCLTELPKKHSISNKKIISMRLQRKGKMQCRSWREENLTLPTEMTSLEYLLKLLVSLNDKGNYNALKFVQVCNMVQEKIDLLAKYQINETSFTMSSKLSNEYKKILKLGNITLLESSRKICETTNIKKAKFLLISESYMFNKVKGCTFTSSGNILCTDYGKSHCVILLETSLEYKPEIAFNVGPHPWDMEADNGTFYVTQRDDQVTRVQRFSENNFRPLGSLNVGKSCLGITVVGENIYVVSEKSLIIKRNKNGEGTPEVVYQHKTKGLRYLTSISNELIVFTDFSSDSVSTLRLNVPGERAWRYTHPELQGPYGLDKDPSSNVYVVGKKSNNIHILSMSGSLIRILKDIDTPVCIKFKKGSFTCFLAREHTKSISQVMLYKFV
ncbi:E3 ubiquitin-protein ligase Midline-1-like [Saccostrea cucullata]|uniref:E3 ubiquitin-protein ligase Midline-1-like n=1 Tax=Saccostrea cuccullata TaxID=36930 RepID=UPI002ED4E4A8